MGVDHGPKMNTSPFSKREKGLLLQEDIEGVSWIQVPSLWEIRYETLANFLALGFSGAVRQYELFSWR